MSKTQDKHHSDDLGQMFFEFASSSLNTHAPVDVTPMSIPAHIRPLLTIPIDQRIERVSEKPSDGAQFTTEAHAAAIFLRTSHECGEKHIKRVAVRFHPFRATLYSFKINRSGHVVLKLHVAFRRASEDVLAQAARVMLGRRKGRKVERGSYDAFVRSIPETDFELPGARRAVTRASTEPGVHRSLDESFDRVNLEYFKGQLERPQLCWSPVRAKRLLGSYHHRKDRLIISRVFDSMKVPVVVLDFLMYHELLHKFLGVGRLDDGRRCVHSKEFRALEKQFKHFQEARHFLKRI